ncbi:MAG: N,N-dimethylformamidase beta subunit family domain-containing protein [Solirubrobacterales bacterium]
MNDALELIGYTGELSVEAGQSLDVKVSSAPGRYEAKLVRLLHGDEHPDGPGFQEREVASAIEGEHEGRVQAARAGSYVEFAEVPVPAGFAVEVWVWPTSPSLGRRQAIVSRPPSGPGAGWSLALDPDGRFEWRVGTAVARLEAPAAERRWVRLLASCADSGALRLESRPAPTGLERQPAAAASAQLDRSVPSVGALFLAAAEDPAGAVGEHFNGKLEAPSLRSAAGEVLADWDLGADPDGDLVHDRGPSGLEGRVVNRPDRAMTGHSWNGAETDFRQAPEQYGAIAFHDDDLDDAGWETDFSLEVPADLESGVYAIRLRAEGAREDHLPFVVRPPRGRAAAPIALVLPTFTYMAYANDHVLRLRDEAWKYTAIPVRYDPLDELPERHREWGCSLYDSHSDGSGVTISSRLRPIVNLRPRYRWWASGGAQYVASDLYIVHWLERLGVRVDVFSDDDLHREGGSLLEPYRAVLTGTHPEYVTAAMLDAVESYLGAGGRLMYLGGNGFYWVTSVPAGAPHLIEVRRGVAGTRAWESRPGEEHHATTGERGGLWRHRGRAPNQLVGIGFAAQGWSDPSPGYHRTEASREAPVSWIFEGVEADVVGDYGLAMNGAAGDELDRFDAALGSPPETVVLASSRGHGRQYVLVHEDLLQTTLDISGETNPDVRADLTYLETAAGGAVFSVGSKSWCASLSWNDYDNDVARVSENVLRRFLGDGDAQD